MLLLLVALLATQSGLMAQDTTSVMKKRSYTKNTFEGNFLIDNQSVMVPIKGTFEFDLVHRFGTFENGYKDFYGIFSGANMRLGFSYVVVKDLQLGFGLSNYNMQLDGNVKFALLRQTKDNAFPVSITYYGDLAIDTRAKNSSLPIVTFSDRMRYFNQILVARKVTNNFSVQAGFSISHFNNVEGYYDEQQVIQPRMKNDHMAVCFGGRYKLSAKLAIVVNYDQPLTQHPLDNPHPNLSVGLDMTTSSHNFQITIGNYGYTLGADNNFLNQNDYNKSQFVIGFNMSRLWNF